MFLQIDVEALLRDSMPPDDECLYLIEQAFLDGQIDGETLSLAFLWIERNDINTH
jgi:hypothetical protein